MILPSIVEDTLGRPWILIGLVLSVILALLYAESRRTNIPAIKGIPTVPGNVPFLGRLGDLGGRLQQNDATIYSRWSAKLLGGADVFQVKLGDQRTVVVSSFAAIRDLWVKQSNALIDRPHQPGFADRLRGLDLSGAAMTPTIRRCRAAAMRALGKPRWPGYYGILETSAASFVGELHLKGQNGRAPMNVYPYLRLIVFDLVLSLTYGARQKGVDDPFIVELVRSIREISSHRSSTARYRDFVPLIRWLVPEPTSTIVAAEEVRQRHLDVLYAELQQRLRAGDDKVDCIAAQLQGDGLTDEEIDGTCKSLLQAAPGTVASGIYQCVAWLCGSEGGDAEGQAFQAEAYEAILAAYGGDRDRAWEAAFREDGVPLVLSLCKETLRYYTVTPYATPRRAATDLHYRGSVIPRGTTVIMNAQEGNHDAAWFGADADRFVPSRFIGNDSPLPHLTYGAGSRICPAVGISNRIMAAVVIRLILAFRMRPGPTKPSLDMIDFSSGYTAVLSPPREFDCCFEARDEVWLRERLEKDTTMPL
ncbi:cytochrome P450 [Xylariales sp. PMI_506]|nr:cytochrome P450 [Xylariales sp. PMI_506]